jgi:hypothetical protein
MHLDNGQLFSVNLHFLDSSTENRMVFRIWTIGGKGEVEGEAQRTDKKCTQNVVGIMS